MRTDIHRPSVIKPDEYVLVACFTRRDAESKDAFTQMRAMQELRAEREAFLRHQAQTGATMSDHAHGGDCHVCGAYCTDSAVFWHEPTNTYIETGFDCAEKLDMGDARRFRHFRTVAKAAEEMKAGKAKARMLLEHHGIERAQELAPLAIDAASRSAVADVILYEAGVNLPRARYDRLDDVDLSDEPDLTEKARKLREIVEGVDYDLACRALDDLSTARDIVRKTERFGSISDGQVQLIRRILDRLDSIGERQAERRQQHSPAPSGRVQVEGEVIKLTEQENPYGTTPKMVVKDDRGFVVYLTVPRALLVDADRGARVRFVATLTTSPDDAAFAFGKRPARAELLTEEADHV